MMLRIIAGQVDEKNHPKPLKNQYHLRRRTNSNLSHYVGGKESHYVGGLATPCAAAKRGPAEAVRVPLAGNLTPHHLCNLVLKKDDQMDFLNSKVVDEKNEKCRSGGGFNSHLSLLYALRAI